MSIVTSAPRLTRRKVFISVFPLVQKPEHRRFSVSTIACWTLARREESRTRIEQVQRDAAVMLRIVDRLEANPLQRDARRAAAVAAIARAASGRALTQEIKQVSRETTVKGWRLSRGQSELRSCDRSCATNAAKD